ncbi:rubrerythrin family protein [Mollicutes bacterium LVI A0039]|nr:rubrerythrin family protein [Mollicutes bacterium LVI A0039]
MTNTKTFQNLTNAFIGESQAFQRYTMYAKIAKKEGWSNIAAIFEETAINEKLHAKQFYNFLLEMVGEEMPGMMESTASYPIARKTTYDNLMYAAGGEHEEVGDYNLFAEQAMEEGFKDVAAKFKLIAAIEQHHGDRYQKIAELLKVEQFGKDEGRVMWKCMKCGHIHTGKAAPAVCPVCDHAAGYFEKYELNI